MLGSTQKDGYRTKDRSGRLLRVSTASRRVASGPLAILAHPLDNRPLLTRLLLPHELLQDPAEAEGKQHYGATTTAIADAAIASAGDWGTKAFYHGPWPVLIWRAA